MALPRRDRRALLVALGLTLLLAGVASGVASTSPDGLESVAGRHGFADSATASPFGSSPVAGYEVDGVDSPRVSGGLAGVLGVLVTLALTVGAARVVRRRASEPGGPDASPGPAEEPARPDPPVTRSRTG